MHSVPYHRLKLPHETLHLGQKWRHVRQSAHDCPLTPHKAMTERQAAITRTDINVTGCTLADAHQMYMHEPPFSLIH